MDYKCPSCKYQFSDEKPDDDSQERPLCSNCGNRAGKIIYGKGSSIAYVSMSAVGTVTWFTEAFLRDAERLFSAGEHSVAVVVAQTACETSTARIINAFLDNKKVGELKSIFSDMLPSYNIGSDRVRRLYFAVTGNDLTKESFWPKLKTSASLRNAIVHHGASASEAEARDAIAAIKEYIEHIKQL